ncbi:unnamed protein product [Peronospora effusa]|uniref:Uncharacterized protein n=1 Tax=Peronospora effusa TaxID=542832 RepID=A0A3M6VC08_9STRA|nr:hypothetical protein DD238_007559 [Peronospora effusa]RQM12329.1 hypothetical protein DD237_007755 [Peronospora effusa]CAI5703030.1 unnamed protein product [Peronospora effusa]
MTQKISMVAIPTSSQDEIYRSSPLFDMVRYLVVTHAVGGNIAYGVLVFAECLLYLLQADTSLSNVQTAMTELRTTT